MRTNPAILRGISSILSNIILLDQRNKVNNYPQGSIDVTLISSQVMSGGSSKQSCTPNMTVEETMTILINITMKQANKVTLYMEKFLC